MRGGRHLWRSDADRRNRAPTSGPMDRQGHAPPCCRHANGFDGAGDHLCPLRAELPLPRAANRAMAHHGQRVDCRFRSPAM